MIRSTKHGMESTVLAATVRQIIPSRIRLKLKKLWVHVYLNRKQC